MPPNCRRCSIWCEREGFHKFYLSHLVYAGRGNKNRGDDAQLRDHARRHGPGHRPRLGLGATRRWTWKSSPATTTPTPSISCTGRARAAAAVRRLRAQLAAVGRQLLRRQRRQYRQSRQCPSRHDVVALHARQCARAAVLGDLARHAPTRSWPGLKAQPRQVGGRCGTCALLRRLRRQHARARHAGHAAIPGRRTPAAISTTKRSRRVRRRGARLMRRLAALLLFAAGAGARAAPAEPVYQTALRDLPRRAAPRRHGAGAAAGEPLAPEEARGRRA